MTNETQRIRENHTLADTARMMRYLGFGSLPVCGDDDRLKGMITDGDIVIECIADGQDPTRAHADELAHGKPVTIGDIDLVLQTMTDHEIRRLLVIDGHDLAGIVSQGDIARNGADERIGALVASISD